MNKIFLYLSLILTSLNAHADALDSLQTLMTENPQIQEKIYVHLDNNCYFVGDTIWYKAYVVKADDFKPTDMSKLLYVELLSPDGFVVERQHVVVSDKGLTCGQFALTDSLYSGYYEIRAYTKWDLNFSVAEKPHTFIDKRRFLTKQLCEDYFRDFEGLYSRVVPVYNKNQTLGDYSQRYMSRRPKQHTLKEKLKLLASFYPEGGNSVQGQPSRIAFEVRDQNGQGINIEGVITNGKISNKEPLALPAGKKITSTYLGRGTFTYTPDDTNYKAVFLWNGKLFSFKLPEPEKTGTTLSYNPENKSFSIKSVGTKPAAYAVLCRGRLVSFQRINGDGTYTITDAPTGVDEVVVYNDDAQPLASRLFFIDNHDYGKHLDITLTSDEGKVNKQTTLPAYAKVNVDVKTPEGGNIPQTVSIAVRDTQTDDPAYDDGNIMTDMLLGSELKGFVASPAYYFSKDDALHRQRLDELMMIQGWRRYARVDEIRYNPEKTTTYEGTVYKLPSTLSFIEQDDISGMQNSTNIAAKMQEEMEGFTSDASSSTSGYSDVETENMSDTSSSSSDSSDSESEIDASTDVSYATVDYLVGKTPRKPICVEAEIEKVLDNGKTQSAGVIMRADKYGHFCIQIPPYYDDAVLFVRAYSAKDSVDKCMAGGKDKKWIDERQYPDYLVKRDVFFPIFSRPYSWYQINSPDLFFIDEDDDMNIPENSRLAGNHTLQTVIVKARRRGKKAIDWTKPALVRDAYSLYNDVTDYGLSFGIIDFKQLPMQMCHYLFGNMGRNTQFNVRAMVNYTDSEDGSHKATSFYRNYTPNVGEYDNNMSDAKMFDYLHMERMQEVRIFTDYELRTDSGDVREINSADVTMDFIPVPNDGKRYTYRDRRYIFPGITYPEQFYSPDYSKAVPQEPRDYRRTLYWNPNAKIDADGTFHDTLYNNCRDTRVTVSAAGIDDSGQLYY